jgi:hypothetical protein
MRPVTAAVVPGMRPEAQKVGVAPRMVSRVMQGTQVLGMRPVVAAVVLGMRPVAAAVVLGMRPVAQEVGTVLMPVVVAKLVMWSRLEMEAPASVLMAAQSKEVPREALRRKDRA